MSNERRVPERDECRGKRICELLKDIRSVVAVANGLNLSERECSHKGECPGTCPVCEMETDVLMRQLEGKNKSDCPFLSGVDLCRFSATDYLPMKLSAGFKGIFKKQLFRTINRNNVDMAPSIDEPIEPID